MLLPFFPFFVVFEKKNLFQVHQKNFFVHFFCAVSGSNCEWTQPLRTKEDKLMKYR